MRKLALMLSFAGLLVTLPAHAEFFGLMNGRTADIANAPERSVEAGAVFGEFFDADYTHFGIRYNHKTSPELMVFGNLGLSEVGNDDGVAFGIGVFYQMQGILTNQDLALKAVLNRANIDDDDLTGFSFEALMSGREGIGANGNMGWYGNLGLHRFSDDDDSETEIGFGGGVIIPATSGEFYAGIDLIEDIIFGAGFRYYLQ